MDHPVMHKGRQVPATHIVTVTAEARIEFMEWEKGNVRDFISKEIESCYDASIEKLFFHKKTMEAVFCVFALNPSYSWDNGEPCYSRTLETGIAIERLLSLDEEMKEKIPFIRMRSIKVKAERIS